MPWSAPTYTGGLVWQDLPSTSTPLNAADLNQVENALAGYTGTVGSSITNYMGDSDPAASQDTLVYNGSRWARLAVGTTGQQKTVRSDGTVKWTSAPIVSVDAWNATGDGTADDTTPWSNAVASALQNGGLVGMGPGKIYKVSQITVNPDSYTYTQPHRPTFGIVGSGRGQSIILGDGTQSPILNITRSASTELSLTLRDFQVWYTASGNAISVQLKNVLHADIGGCIFYGDKCALSIQGSGAVNLTDTRILQSGPVPANPYCALWVGAGNSSPHAQDGTLTSSGPVEISGGYIQATNNSPAIIVEGGSTSGAANGTGAFSVAFRGTQFAATGTQPASVEIDGWATTALFDNCHSESNYNTANTGVDFLIGNWAKPKRVAIRAHTAWGHGNGTNYQKYAVSLVSCRSFTLNGALFSKLGAAHGYDSGIVHFATGYPAAGDLVDISNVDQDNTTGPMYADDNGVVPTSYTAPYRRPARDQSYRAVIAEQTQVNAAQIAAAATALIGPVDPFGGNRADAFFYFNPADYQSPPGATLMLRISASVVVNATAPACNVQLGLVPSSGAPSGGTGAVNLSNGAFVTGSTVTVSTPAAASTNNVVTADFAAPAAGWYAIAASFSAAMAAGSAVAVAATLQAHCTG